MSIKDNVPTEVLKLLEDNCILYITVPNNCTDQLQPLDLSFNKAVKAYMQLKFQEWYGNIAYQQLEDGDTENFDTRMSVKKPLGAQWMINCFDYVPYITSRICR